MTIPLAQFNNLFIISALATPIGLAAANPYLDYVSPDLTSSGTPPVSNELFDYSSEVIEFDGNDVTFDVYDFKDNTIIYGGLSVTLTRIYAYGIAFARNVVIKNLNIAVTSPAYTSIEGYLMGTSNSAPIFTLIDNCHLEFELDTFITTQGLIGANFGNGSITGCSCTFVDGSISPIGGSTSGWITGINAGFSNTGNPDSVLNISNCYSTNLIGSGGGITGNTTGLCVIATSTVTISNCYSTGSIAAGGGGICGSQCGSTTQAVTVVASTITITGCYSSGTIAAGGGGICGQEASIVIVFSGAIATSNVTISDCYSIGAIAGNAGGITGTLSASSTAADTVANLSIGNCYSTGAIANTATGGGICGNLLASTGGTIVVTIDCCYTLNGTIPINNFGTGNLIGDGAILGNLTSDNNSFNYIMDGTTDETGKVTLTFLAAGCVGYSPVFKCAFTLGEAPILNVFLDCDMWRADVSCIEAFTPSFGLCTCPLEESIGLEWPVTMPGIIVEYPCDENNVIFSRECSGNGNWEFVTAVSCDGGSDNTGTISTVTLTIIVSVLGALLVAMFIVLIFTF